MAKLSLNLIPSEALPEIHIAFRVTPEPESEAVILVQALGFESASELGGTLLDLARTFMTENAEGTAILLSQEGVSEVPIHTLDTMVTPPARRRFNPKPRGAE